MQLPKLHQTKKHPHRFCLLKHVCFKHDRKKKGGLWNPRGGKKDDAAVYYLVVSTQFEKYARQIGSFPQGSGWK